VTGVQTCALPISDAHVVGDEHVLTEATAFADDRCGHHVAEVPDLGARADAGAVVDIGALMHVRFGLAHGAVGTLAPVMGRVIGSPFIINERWAAWRTLNTCNPLRPSVRGDRRDSTACRNAWHSRLSGSSSAKSTSRPSPL